MILSIRDLHVRYGHVEALKGIDIDVGDNEMISVVGANGAGKSTLLRTISGLLPAASGQILYRGVDLVGQPSHRIVRSGVVQVPEGRMALAKLTVRDNLLAAGAVREDRKAMLDDLDRVMDRFPILRERRDQLAGTLSGGQQQMMVIARALMAAPRLLLLDEPSLGLAPVIVDQVFAIIEETRAQGVAILLVEQNARRAMQISDRTYVLETGRVSHHGTSADLIDDPRVRESYLGG